MLKRWDIDDETVNCSSFATPEGTCEYYLVLTTNEARSFERAITKLTEKYQSTLQHLNLPEQSLAFCRLYVSDIRNQRIVIAESELCRQLRHGTLSVIQQTPLTHDSIVAFAYHLKKENAVHQKQVLDVRGERWPTGMVIKGDHYAMVWRSNLVGFGPLNSRQQTEQLFESLSDFLRGQNLSIRNNLARTWIFVRDIDNHYAGMVDARRMFFEAQGLCNKTRFVASTGIEGKAADSGALVTMDSLSFGNIGEEQVEKIDAFEHLSPTTTYNVEFERGLRLRFGDRSHLYISGTASIDKDGKILHEGDVEAQTRRTIDNVEALLRSQGATLDDMAYAICYLRNPKHYESVAEIVTERLPRNIPLVIAEGAVCRPGWLFEMEGVGIVSDDNPFPPFM
jgi:enamine deaminase RidA (YjgF/YER057c/UK114 family)